MKLSGDLIRPPKNCPGTYTKKENYMDIIPEVNRLADFPKGSYVAQFLGKSYEEALEKAYQWQIDTGNNCLKYFKQKLITKYYSILVCYERKETFDA